MNSKIIAVDFDGTLCENKWPEIGEPIYRTIDYLLKEKKAGAKLILWTCRVGEMLEKAVAWCAEHDLKFDAVNENLPEIIESFGSDTRKIFANEYLDDRNLLYNSGVADIPEWIYEPINDPPTDDFFDQIEETLGFKLFIWQKTYIMGLGYRCSGQTTADILRALVGEHTSATIYLRRPKNRKEAFYQEELIRIKRKLDEHGIISRGIERESSND